MRIVTLELWNAIQFYDLVYLDRSCHPESYCCCCRTRFFFISGYLFFYKIDDYNLKTYRSKLSRRIWTLLIPYLLWNTLPVVYPLLLFLFRGQPFTLSFAEWLSFYWDTGGEYNVPANFPLWYVRDLMIVCLMTPVIWVLTKRSVMGEGFVALLTIAYVFGLWPRIVGHSNSVFFFTLVVI